MALLSPNRSAADKEANGTNGTRDVHNGVFFEALRTARSAIQAAPTLPAAQLLANQANVDVGLPIATRSTITSTVLAASAAITSSAAAAAGALDFRFPIGMSTELCWNRWHNAPNALRDITPRFFASSSLSREEVGRELAKRRKIKGVMEILQGQTTDLTVDLDPSYVWKRCWERCMNLFGLDEKRARAWALSTLYDTLTKQPERMIEARASPPITPP
jgi:hypothetical protein